MKRKDPTLIWFILAFALMLAAFLAAKTEAHAAADGNTYYVAVSATSSLNVRERPSKEAAVLTEKVRGDILTATGNTDGLWVEVYTDSYTYRYREGQEVEVIGPLNGWVQIIFLSEEMPYGNVNGSVVKGKTWFRSEPRIARETEIRKLDKGEEVALLSVFACYGEMWYRVQLGKERGFMMAACLEVNEK